MEQAFKKIGILLLGLVLGAGTGWLSGLFASPSVGWWLLNLPTLFGFGVLLAAYFLLKLSVRRLMLTYLMMFGVLMGAMQVTAFGFLLNLPLFSVGGIAGGFIMIPSATYALAIRRPYWLIVGSVLVAGACIGVDAMIFEARAGMKIYNDIDVHDAATRLYNSWYSIGTAVWQSIMMGFLVLAMYEERLRHAVLVQAAPAA